MKSLNAFDKVRSIFKEVVYLVIALSFTIFHAAQAATYTVSELLPTPLDVPSVVNTVTWDRTDTGYPDDDDKVLVNIGFPFTFKDTAYTSVRILTNGVLHFGADQRLHRVFNNVTLPTASADRFIAPYWDDLVDDAQATVTYGMKGSAPSRSFIVTWNNVRAYSNNLRYDFQVVLYENGDIRFRYDNNTANGISATIGIEVDDSDFIQYSYNTSSVRTDFDLFFKNTLLSLPGAVLDMRMDELEWTGATDEVKNLASNSLHGTARNALLNADVSPALAGNPGSCRYADMNGTNQYINIPDNNALDFSGNFTVAAWIKIDSLPASGLKTIVSKDENYEFHVKPNGSINWWWQTVTPNATRQFDSTGRVTPGVWTHVAIRYQANNQTIFINGQPSGSATFTGSTVTNSDPLQIGADQNLNGRYFNGDIDEVRVFNQALSDTQMITLASETHFCALANSGCSAVFPDALSSYNDGTLTFNSSGQLVNSPDNILQFSSIDPAGNTVCNGATCNPDPGNPVPEINFGSFPDTGSFTQNFTINNNQTDTLGNSGQQYNRVSVGQNSTMNVNPAVSTYYIDDLHIQRDAFINLQPGDYWIRSLRIGRNSLIKVLGSGTARLFIKDNINFERDIWFNPNDNLGLTGDASKLLIYAEGDISFDRNTRLWGGVYAKGDISLDRDSSYKGALSAANISINQNTYVNYDAGAMTKLDFGSLCTSASCNFGGFQITSSPTVALACPQSRAAIGFQAMCADGVNPKTDFAGTINLSSSENSLSQFFTVSSGGSPVSSMVLTGSELGQGTVYLYHQNENSALQVSLSDQATSLAQTTSIDFRSSGFAVTGPTNFICGNSSTLTLSAIGQVNNTAGSCALLTGFSGTKNLSVWASANYSPTGPVSAETLHKPLVLNTTNISANTQPASSNFSTSFVLGQATINVAHLDSAQVLGLEFAHDDGVAGTPLMRGTSSGFVVSPSTVKVSTPSICVSGDHNCSAFARAGSNFNMTATAQCADASSTTATSYRSASNIDLNLNLISPTAPNGVNGSLGQTTITIAASDSGAKTITNQSVSEVGVFNISTQVPAYFGQPVASSASSNIGRFYPDHFDAVLSSANFANTCSGFTYLDQGFFFNTSPTLTIEAKNTNGVLTQNYEGNFWKLGANLQEQGSCSGVGLNKGFCYSDNLGVLSFTGPNASQSYGNLANVNGALTMNLHNQSFDTFNYSRPLASASVPFDADVKLQVELEDADGVTGSASLEHIGFVSDSDVGTSNMNINNDQLLRHGRWKMSNAYGPETQNLSIQAYAEYYSLQNKFEFNSDDQCTVLTSGDITLNGASSSTPVSVGSGTSNFTFNSPLVAGEKENFQLTRPGAGNTGNVLINVDLLNLPWLKYDWDMNGSLDNHPAIKATFGQYRGHDRIIYWREVSN